jgi:hypothetical protein
MLWASTKRTCTSRRGSKNVGSPCSEIIQLNPKSPDLVLPQLDHIHIKESATTSSGKTLQVVNLKAIRKTPLPGKKKLA